MENCPYLDGCLKREPENVSLDCCDEDYVSRRCYMVEDVVRIWTEELELAGVEDEMFRFELRVL
jgi:hypothetical protein